MPAFKFKIGDRVFVPGTKGLQGLVTGRAEFRNREHEYGVTWLGDELKIQERGFKQSEIHDANEEAIFVWMLGRAVDAKQAAKP